MGKKFNELTAATALTGVELFPADQGAETKSVIISQVLDYVKSKIHTSGTGSPEGVDTGPVGKTYHQIESGVLVGVWMKVSGTGNTGWQQWFGDGYGTVNPEGVVSGVPGKTYLNATDESFWIKKTGSGNTGWIALII